MNEWVNESTKYTQHQSTDCKLITRDYLGVLGAYRGPRVVPQTWSYR